MEGHFQKHSVRTAFGASWLRLRLAVATGMIGLFALFLVQLPENFPRRVSFSVFVWVLPDVVEDVFFPNLNDLSAV